MNEDTLFFYHQKAISMCEKYSDVLNQIIDYKTICNVYDRNGGDECYIIGRELISHLEWLKTVDLTEIVAYEGEDENTIPKETADLREIYDLLALYMERLPDSYSYAREYRRNEGTLDIQYFHKALFLYMTKEEQTHIIDNYINMTYYIINVLDEIAFDIRSSFDMDTFHGIPLFDERYQQAV